MSGRGVLRRSRTDRIIAGVLGGFAEYSGMEPSFVRIVYVLLTIGTAFAGGLVYIICWLVIPEEA